MTGKGNGKEPRTALLIRCSEEEAEAIRETAKQQRRTVSSFVIGAVMNRVSILRAGGAVQKRERFLGSAPARPDELLPQENQTPAMKSGQAKGNVSSKSR